MHGSLLHRKRALRTSRHSGLSDNLMPLPLLQLFRVVPHAAEIERAFSDAGLQEGALRTRLLIENNEMLIKIKVHFDQELPK